MSTAKKKPQSVDTSLDPALQYLNQRAIEVAITPTENSTKSVSFEEVTQVITNVFQVNAPGGANGQLQFNQDGQYIGDAELQYDPYTDTLTTGNIVANNINADTLTLYGGFNGDTLITDGNGTLSWANVFPSVSGRAGKFLVTNGVSIEWSSVNHSSLASTTYVDSAINNLVGMAPGILDTLAEIATVIGDTENAEYSIVAQLANKANIADLSEVAFSGLYTDLDSLPTISTVGTTGNYVDLTNKPTIPSSIMDLGIGDGTVGQVLTTDGDGGFTFTTVSGTRLYGNVDEDVEVTVRHRPAVSAECAARGSGDNFVADTSDNDDITVVQEGWTVDIGGTVYTVTAIISGIDEFDIYATGATFVVGTTYTFTNPTATLKTWTFNNETGTLRAPGGALLSSETAVVGEGDAYRDFSIELMNQVNDNEYRWTFANDAGSLTVPGPIKQGAGELNLNVDSANVVRLSTTDTLEEITDLILHPTLGISLTTNRNVAISAGAGLTELYNIYYGLEQTFADIRDQDAQMFAPGTRLWAGMPSYEAYIVILNYNHSGPELPPPSSLPPAANAAKNAYEAWQAELAAINVTIDVADNSFIFGADGDLTLPGVLQVSNGIEGSIVGLNGVNIHAKNATPLGLLWTLDDQENLFENNPLLNAVNTSVQFGINGLSIEVNSASAGGYWTFAPNKSLIMPPGGDIVDSNGDSVLGGGSASTGNITFSDTTLTSTNGNVNITFDPVASPAVSFSFTDSGILNAPSINTNEVDVGGAKHSTTQSTECLPNVDTLVFTGSSYSTGTIKVLFHVEGVETVDLESQSCEMMVAVMPPRVAGSVYGLAYTSTGPLATFEARWNSISQLVEITCRPASTTETVHVQTTTIELSILAP